MLQQCGQSMRKRLDQGRVDLRAASVLALRLQATPAAKGATLHLNIGCRWPGNAGERVVASTVIIGFLPGTLQPQQDTGRYQPANARRTPGCPPTRSPPIPLGWPCKPSVQRSVPCR
jgi:hypothetical protein